MFDKILDDSISLGEAIKIIQKELMESEEERRKSGLPRLFVTDKLTLEANCVFVQNDTAGVGFDIKLLSILSAKGDMSSKDESSYVQKIKLEFKTVNENGGSNISGITPISLSDGRYPHDKDNG
ncbi:hypothetical protein QA584_06150 [Anaerocolumna sp. AGMB13025]|uniref:trypco2 family protein n=1 Tax=Anaerocolumna sp. AGMB13025 TaxID=3039116 RepID=UPI00241F4A37|nr:trypco2 family protein [Anaerocolumna sp. AGMB13025]WFR58654.1 hypothetical protein QA584_06150 [Anaerocolumna sp. AGMB13025]